MNEDNVIVLQFAEAIQPSYRENKAEGYILFGDRNDYPEYLLELFDKSAKHGAIISNKANYVAGNGWMIKNGQVDPIADAFIKNPNPNESLNQMTAKMTADIEIFNGAYLQVIGGRNGKPSEVYHLKYETVRTNKDNTQFWVKQDWRNNREKAKDYPAFTGRLFTGSQIYYMKVYRPGQKAYALPVYLGANNYIQADAEVSKHVLTNAVGGFSATKLVTLTNGEPAKEEKKVITKQFERKFSGAEGRKVIIEFVKTAENKTLIQDLGQSDISKEDFTHVDELIQQNIYAGHQITSPALFGIMQAGKLGVTTELEDAYEIFKNTYINARQMFIESVMNSILKMKGGIEQISINPTNPIGIRLKDATLAETVPRSWLLEQLGIDPSKYPDAPAITKSLPTNLTPAPAIQARQNFSADDALAVFLEFGDSRSNYTVLRSRKVRFSSVEDMIGDEQDTGVMAIEMADQVLTTLEANILDLVSKDKRITPEVLSKTLDTDLRIVNKVLNGLVDKKMLEVTRDDNGNPERTLTKPLSELKGESKATTNQYLLRYSYEGPQDDKNRAFCARLLELDRVYSRSDIELISARLGYSVFDRRGGWYTLPGTNIHQPYCRHFWVSQVIIRNNNE